MTEHVSQRSPVRSGAPGLPEPSRSRAPPVGPVVIGVCKISIDGARVTSYHRTHLLVMRSFLHAALHCGRIGTISLLNASPFLRLNLFPVLVLIFFPNIVTRISEIFQLPLWFIVAYNFAYICSEPLPKKYLSHRPNERSNKNLTTWTPFFCAWTGGGGDSIGLGPKLLPKRPEGGKSYNSDVPWMRN